MLIKAFQGTAAGRYLYLYKPPFPNGWEMTLSAGLQSVSVPVEISLAPSTMPDFHKAAKKECAPRWEVQRGDKNGAITESHPVLITGIAGAVAGAIFKGTPE